MGTSRKHELMVDNMNTVISFCEHTEKVFCSADTKDLKKGTINIDGSSTEIYRYRWNNNTTCIFNLTLDVLKLVSLSEQIAYMRTIELFYPKKFSWRFDGKHIQMLGLVEINNNTLGAIGRYGGVNGFIKSIRKRMAEVLRFRDLFEIHRWDIVEDMLLSTGSINLSTNLYCVPIEPDMSDIDILTKASSPPTDKQVLKVLNLKFWIKEVNPDFFKLTKPAQTKKWPLNDRIYNHYPVAIRRIAELKNKGNYNRFLLSTFLLSVHNERDAKHQLNTFLSTEELDHMNSGNCKDQWRTIVAKGYSGPSPKTLIEAGFANSVEECLIIPYEEENDYE